MATRRSSVTVQMADNPDDLPTFEELASTKAAARPPQRGPDEPDEPLPGGDVPGEPIPGDDPADPDDDDNGYDDEDDELDHDTPADPSPAASPPAASPAAAARQPAAPLHPDAGSKAADPRSRADRLINPDPQPGHVHYEARITIVDAYQYPGSVHSAPSWVDRNWVAYADEDVLRGISAGPALLVPTYRGDNVYCRVGDYVARQEVRVLADEPGEMKIEVWPRDQFERIFIPVRQAGKVTVQPSRTIVAKPNPKKRARSTPAVKSRARKAAVEA